MTALNAQTVRCRLPAPQSYRPEGAIPLFRARPERGTNTYTYFSAAIRSPAQARPSAYLDGATGVMVDELACELRELVGR
jgi:hypothetical protein